MQTAPFVTDLFMLNFDFCWLVEPLFWALGFMLSMLANKMTIYQSIVGADIGFLLFFHKLVLVLLTSMTTYERG
jgi:hypothetical protein